MQKQGTVTEILNLLLWDKEITSVTPAFKEPICLSRGKKRNSKNVFTEV